MHVVVLLKGGPRASEVRGSKWCTLIYLLLRKVKSPTINMQSDLLYKHANEVPSLLVHDLTVDMIVFIRNFL